MNEACKELVIAAQVEKLPEVLSFIEQQLEEADCPYKAQMQITVAAEEVFVNIAQYAYAPGSGTAKVRVAFSDAPRTVTLTFLDSGKPFDPFKKGEPDVTLSAEEREIGGLGIYMTKKAVDAYSYDFQDGQNKLTLVKRI